MTNNEAPCAGPPQLPPQNRVVCGGGYKLASNALLGPPPNPASKYWRVDAVHVRTKTTSVGGHAIGVLYNATDAAGGAPGHLLATSAPVLVPVGLDGWLRLPLTASLDVTAGSYYIGYLLEQDQDCYSPVVGGANHDVFSVNSWPTPSAVWGKIGAGGTDIDVYASALPAA